MRQTMASRKVQRDNEVQTNCRLSDRPSREQQFVSTWEGMGCKAKVKKGWIDPLLDPLLRFFGNETVKFSGNPELKRGGHGRRAP
jgi:hypothetical protein